MPALITCPGQRCGVRQHFAGSEAARQCSAREVTAAAGAGPVLVSAAAAPDKEQLFIEASVIDRSTAGVRWALQLESATSEEPVNIEYLGRPQEPSTEQVLTHLQVHRPDVLEALGLNRQNFTATELAQHCIDVETEDITALAHLHDIDVDELFGAVLEAEEKATPRSLKEMMQRRHQQNLDALANVAEPETGDSPWLRYGLPGPHELRTGINSRDEAVQALDAVDSEESWAWSRTLTHPEHNAIWQYCGADYYNINEALREGSEMDQVEEELVQRLDSALAKAPVGTPRVLYRGFSVPEWATAETWIPQTFEVGSEVTFPSFLSTSRDVSTATRFAQNSESGVVLEILTGQGVSVSSVSRHGDGERERILPRNLSMKVVAVHRDVPFSSYGSMPKPWTVVQLVEVSALQEQS